VRFLERLAGAYHAFRSSERTTHPDVYGLRSLHRRARYTKLATHRSIPPSLSSPKPSKNGEQPAADEQHAGWLRWPEDNAREAVKDSASIAYRWIKPGGGFVLATLRVGSNQPPFEVADVGCTTTFLGWSPSGEWIACGTARGPLLVSPDGKVKRTLPRLNAYAEGCARC
jgi:hypothetical protein